MQLHVGILSIRIAILVGREMRDECHRPSKEIAGRVGVLYIGMNELHVTAQPQVVYTEPFRLETTK